MAKEEKLKQEEEDEENGFCYKLYENFIFWILSILRSLGLFHKSTLESVNKNTKLQEKKSTKSTKIDKMEKKLKKLESKQMQKHQYHRKK